MLCDPALTFVYLMVSAKKALDCSIQVLFICYQVQTLGDWSWSIHHCHRNLHAWHKQEENTHISLSYDFPNTVVWLVFWDFNSVQHTKPHSNFEMKNSNILSSNICPFFFFFLIFIYLSFPKSCIYPGVLFY